MSELPADDPRATPLIGCVSYLNSRPLVFGHEREVSFETPASLTDGLRAGRLQVALAPIFALVSHPGYLMVDGVGIVSHGPVYSVVIAYRGELTALRRLYLDPASRSSANLQRVLLAEFHGLHPHNELLPPPDAFQPELAEGEGALLIGDRAIDFRLRHGDHDGFRYFDLGDEWRKATGLPFVFAGWHIQPGTGSVEALADRLRTWRDEGVRQIEGVIAAETRYSPAFARYYLTECIHFRVDGEAKRAVAEYARLLHKYGVVKTAAPAGGFRWV